MKLFALKDANDPDAAVLAVLACYEKRGAARFEESCEYFIDLPPDADPWNVPLVLSSFASRRKWAIDGEWSRRWVESRLVPESRQNLGEVFKANGLERYDTLRLLEMTGGRNSQDDCYLEPVARGDEPVWLLEREAGRIREAVALPGARLLVAFRDGSVACCDIVQLAEGRPGLARPLSDRSAFERVDVIPGGRGVRWGSRIALDCEELHLCAQPVGLSWDDLAKAAPALLVDAPEAADMMGCTRQNVNALVKRGALPVAKAGGKSTLFLRADVRDRRDASSARA